MQGAEGGAAIVGAKPPLKKGGIAETLLSRLAQCIDRGIDLVRPSQDQVRGYVQEIQAVNATLDPTSGCCSQRRRRYEQLRRRFEKGQAEPIFLHMSKLMTSFAAGLFAGGGRVDLPQDNLDLERWFRLPKGHERRLHGHSHAGVRIVQEGPTLLLALDAHRHHPAPFAREDLYPYRHAEPPESQQQAIHRRKVMRKARSGKKRSLLLKDLEARYRAAI